MRDRDRLIELIESARCWGADTSWEIATSLLSAGVIVPPCKVGDTVYWAFCDEAEIAEVFEGFVRGLSISQNGTIWFSVVYDNGLTFEHIFKDYFGKTVFLTKEEAENALKERREKDATT